MKPTSIVLMAGLTLSLLVLPGVAVSLAADPIKDGTMDPYKAGWYPNSSPQGPLTCPVTCKLKANAPAEHEPSAEPLTKVTFVCKVMGRPTSTTKPWLYGNQFDNQPVCYFTGRDLKGHKSSKFYCLCVIPVRTG